MCQTKPGPRCASHVMEEVEAAKAGLEAAKAAERKYADSDEGRNGSDEAFEKRSGLRVAVQDAQYALSQKEGEYEGTPTGIKIMKGEYKEALEDGDTPRASALYRKIDIAERAHKTRVNAGQFAKKLKKEAEDEAKQTKSSYLEEGAEYINGRYRIAPEKRDEFFSKMISAAQSRYDFAAKNLNEKVGKQSARSMDYRIYRKSYLSLLQLKNVAVGAQEARLTEARALQKKSA